MPPRFQRRVVLKILKADALRPSKELSILQAFIGPALNSMDRNMLSNC